MASSSDQTRNLSSVDWLPRISRIIQMVSKEDEDDLMQGAYDMHVHAFPDIIQRYSIIDTCWAASRAGMGGLVFKCMHSLTADSAWIVQQFLNRWASKRNVSAPKVYGGVVLNNTVGGLNPETVQIAASFPNCKAIWMPTSDAAHELRRLGIRRKGLTILTKEGELKPDVKTIVELVADASEKLHICSGHLSPSEIMRLVEYCTSMSVDTIVDHPTEEKTRLSLKQMKEVAMKGAYVGLYAVSCMPNIYVPACDPLEAVEIIRELGPDKVILASDYGTYLNVNPVDGLRLFIRSLLALGVCKNDIETMVKRNPSKVLDL